MHWAVVQLHLGFAVDAVVVALDVGFAFRGVDAAGPEAGEDAAVGGED